MGHRRKGFHREAGVFTFPAQVTGTISRRKGKIHQGKAPSPIKGFQKGFMTNQAINLGYIKEGQAISDIPDSKMDGFARELVKKVGAGRASRMVNAQINLRPNEPSGLRSKILIAKGAIRRKSKVLRAGKR